MTDNADSVPDLFGGEQHPPNVQHGEASSKRVPDAGAPQETLFAILSDLKKFLQQLPDVNQPSQKEDGPYQVPAEYDTPVFWRESSKLLAAHQEDQVRVMDKNLDTLLIFAGLFSAVNSTIIAFSLNLLSPAPSDETNALLRQMITSPGNQILPETSFSVANSAIWTNILFSLSLSLSLMSGFGAVLGKQWLLPYARVTPGANDEKEARERSQKMKGAEQWRLRPMLEAALPMLLQAALALFLIGIVIFLWSLNRTIALLNLVFISIGFIVFLFTILVALLNPNCPFQTPYSTSIIPTMIDVFTALPIYLTFLLRRFIALHLSNLHYYRKRDLRDPQRLKNQIAKSRFRNYIRNRQRDYQDEVTADIIDFMSDNAEERNACLATLNQIPTLRLRETVLCSGKSWSQISESAASATASRAILARTGIDVDYQILRLRAFLHISASGASLDVSQQDVEGVDRMLAAAQEKMPQQIAIQELANIFTLVSNIQCLDIISKTLDNLPRPLYLVSAIQSLIFDHWFESDQLWTALECFSGRDVIPEPVVVGVLGWVLSKTEELERIKELGIEEVPEMFKRCGVRQVLEWHKKVWFPSLLDKELRWVEEGVKKVEELGLPDGLWKAYTAGDHEQLQYARDAVAKYQVSREVVKVPRFDSLYASLIRGSEPILLSMLQRRSREDLDSVEQTCNILSKMLQSIIRQSAHIQGDSQDATQEDSSSVRKQLRVTLSACIMRDSGITSSSSDGILLPGELWGLLASWVPSEPSFAQPHKPWVYTAVLSLLTAEPTNIPQEHRSAVQSLVECLEDWDLSKTASTFLATSVNWFNMWDDGIHGLFIQHNLHSVLLSHRHVSFENAAAVLRILLEWPTWREAISSKVNSLKSEEFKYMWRMERLFRAWQISQHSVASNNNTPTTATENIGHDLGTYWMSTEFITMAATYIQFLANKHQTWWWEGVQEILGPYIEFAEHSISPERADEAKALVEAYRQLEEKWKSNASNIEPERILVRLWKRMRRKQAHQQDTGPAV